MGRRILLLLLLCTACSSSAATSTTDDVASVANDSAPIESEPLDSASADPSQPAPTHDQAESRSSHEVLECNSAQVSMEFLTELPLAEGNFPGMVDAIQPFLSSEEGVLWEIDGEWRVAHADEDLDASPQATLVAGDGTTFSWMFLEMIDGEWSWRGSSSGGDCELHIVLDGLNTVEWNVTSSSAERSTVNVSASELECVSGQPMDDRLRDPVVTLTPEFAYILLAADPPPGDFQNCQGNPSVDIEVDLGEPLGDREIRNTQTSMGWFSDYWPDE